MATGEPQAGPAEADRPAPPGRRRRRPARPGRASGRPGPAARAAALSLPVQAPPPSREQAVPRPAARGAQARLDRRAGTLTITLRGLAPRAVVFAAGRRVRVVAGGRIVLPVLTPRRFVLVVAAPRQGPIAYALTRFRVTVPARGPARVMRL